MPITCGMHPVWILALETPAAMSRLSLAAYHDLWFHIFIGYAHHREVSGSQQATATAATAAAATLGGQLVDALQKVLKVPLAGVFIVWIASGIANKRRLVDTQRSLDHWKISWRGPIRDLARRCRQAYSTDSRHGRASLLHTLGLSIFRWVQVWKS